MKVSPECWACAALACPSALCKEFQLASFELSSGCIGVRGVCTVDARSEFESAVVVVILDALVAETTETAGETSSDLRLLDDLTSGISSTSSSSSVSRVSAFADAF